MKHHLAIREQFMLNPDIHFLNHGSFGACPIPIFENYQHWQRKLEADSVQFMTKIGPAQLAISRQAMASYIHCNGDDIVFMPNPTTALNTVIRSLELQEGDEILTTDNEYGALDRTWNYYCNKTGANYVHAPITLPLVSKEQFIADFWKGLSKKTKIVFISHITSPTALIFPVKDICARAKELGLITIVDGAHVPGHIPLDLSQLDADVYTGACHKWLLAPKGNTFLFVKKELQASIDPLIISWGYQSATPSSSQFLDYHQLNGTRDFSAYLTTQACFQFFEENNWEEEKKTCRTLLKHYYPIVAKELDSSILCPLSDDYLGQICSIPIRTKNSSALKEYLFEKHKIEIPITSQGSNYFLRISFQAYNSHEEIERLIDAIREIKAHTHLLQ